MVATMRLSYPLGATFARRTHRPRPFGRGALLHSVAMAPSASDRERAADERDLRADERDRQADERERKADERDRLASGGGTEPTEDASVVSGDLFGIDLGTRGDEVEALEADDGVEPTPPQATPKTLTQRLAEAAAAKRSHPTS
jgi:hypothetical protein